ncbi:hypothetical protein [Chloracidobacterium aggregatum]|nr:hypothetical protein [Chloracidobacterium aggregatum]
MLPLPRLTFWLSMPWGNLIARALHCHVGKPHLWFLPPSWM